LPLRSLSATAAQSGIPLRRIHPAPVLRRRLLCPAPRQRDFDLAFLDIEDRIRRTALREDRFVLAIFGDAPAAIHGGEKYFRVKRDFFLFLCHERCALRRPTPIIKR
jgi:hypothetical protein